MTSLILPSYSFPKVSALVVLLVFLCASPANAQNEQGENECEQLITILNGSVDEAWNDLDFLELVLNVWQAEIRESFEWYSPPALRGASTETLEEARAELTLLRDCAPEIKKVFDRLKARITQLEGLPEQVQMSDKDRNKDLHHRRRQKKLKDLEELHAEVVDLLDDILGE